MMLKHPIPLAIIECPMPQIYRITKGPYPGELVDSIGALEAFALQYGPGRVDVDEQSLDPFPGTKVTCKAWGNAIHHQDGQVVLDPIPWQSRAIYRTTARPIAPRAQPISPTLAVTAALQRGPSDGYEESEEARG
jgi:hypothetical protein